MPEQRQVPYGCSGSSSGGSSYAPNPLDPDPINDDTPDRIVAGGTGHNCGGRCITRAYVKDNKITRFLTDETAGVEDGTIYAGQSRACARCRGYRGRIYNPGRLKYPMKQTKKRGDLTGFKRITWDEALDELGKKFFKTTDKWGRDSFYVLYASGQVGRFQRGGYFGPNMRRIQSVLGGWIGHFGSYSAHQASYISNAFTGQLASPDMDHIAENTENLVMWGSNLELQKQNTQQAQPI